MLACYCRLKGAHWKHKGHGRGHSRSSIKLMTERYTKITTLPRDSLEPAYSFRKRFEVNLLILREKSKMTQKENTNANTPVLNCFTDAFKNSMYNMRMHFKTLNEGDIS